MLFQKLLKIMKKDIWKLKLIYKENTCEEIHLSIDASL